MRFENRERLSKEEQAVTEIAIKASHGERGEILITMAQRRGENSKFVNANYVGGLWEAHGEQGAPLPGGLPEATYRPGQFPFPKRSWATLRRASGSN